MSKENEKKVGGGFAPDMLDKFMERVSSTDGGAPPPILRREAEIVIPMRECEPGLFDEDFKVLVRSISSADELAALGEAKNETQIGHAMAKRAMVALNGQRLQTYQRDLVWTALGFAGRARVVSAFLEHCTGAGEAALGKSSNEPDSD